MAADNCQSTSWLKKQVKEARAKWEGLFMEVKVKSIDDMIGRYVLLGENTRMKLCTLAHFWNYSNPVDRREYLKTFLSLIGGEVASEESDRCVYIDDQDLFCEVCSFSHTIRCCCGHLESLKLMGERFSSKIFFMFLPGSSIWTI